MHPGDLDHEDMNRITSSMIFDHYVISNVLLFSTFFCCFFTLVYSIVIERICDQNSVDG